MITFHSVIPCLSYSAHVRMISKCYLRLYWSIFSSIYIYIYDTPVWHVEIPWPAWCFHPSGRCHGGWHQLWRWSGWDRIETQSQHSWSAQLGDWGAQHGKRRQLSKVGFGEAEIYQVHEVEEHGYGLFSLCVFRWLGNQRRVVQVCEHQYQSGVGSFWITVLSFVHFGAPGLETTPKGGEAFHQVTRMAPASGSEIHLRWAHHSVWFSACWKARGPCNLIIRRK